MGCCAFSHAVLDWTSTWHFMSSWAQICSGSRSSSRPHRSWTAPSPGAPASSWTSPNPKSSNVPVRARPQGAKSSESAIDSIKSTVNANPPPDGSKTFSTFPSLSAHIWRHVTMARGLKPEEVTVFADCQSRVDPPMPESHFGNLIRAIVMGTAAGLAHSRSVRP